MEDLLAQVLDRRTTRAERTEFLETLRARFIAHAAAHGTVFHDALPPDAPMRLRAIVAMVFEEHREQARAFSRLAEMDPVSNEWLEAVRALRTMMIEHARAEEVIRASFVDLVPPDVRDALPRGYTTERMRRLTA